MELELIHYLRERLPQNKYVAVGPGDDAAVLHATPGMQTVVTTDMLMDGVDFNLAEHDPRRIGRKALAVNLSDVAAMGARPTAAFVSVALPRSAGIALPKALCDGMLELAKQYDVALAGGDTNVWDQPLCISITLLGEVPIGKAWRRRGAKLGDALLATGQFGGSILGKHFDFDPRINEALLLARDYDIHAAIDVSDGLSLDVWRLCQESRLGGILDLPLIPIAPAAHELSRRDGRSPLEHALTDGEDFELVLAAAPDEAARLLKDQPLGTSLTRIGEIVDVPHLFGCDESGTHEIVPRGWVHR
jgi:thiamine-monophosphate kinase